MITELRQYQDEMERTLKPGVKPKYCAEKLVCEAVEILQPYTKNENHGTALNMGKIREEVGDLLFYVAAICSANGWELQDVANENIEKVRERHGDSYNGKGWYKT